MPQSDIDYGHLMHSAMRGLIRKVLKDVEANGLPGEHHFFITFDTMHPDVEIADWLSDRYPGEMTVVMQHEYEGLDVGDDGFFITLSFGNSPEPLYIPFNAIRTFYDPSVEFGLRFESQEDEAAGAEPVQDAADQAPAETDPADKGEAEIVSLDKFRK